MADRWYVRAVVKDTNPPFDAEKEVRTVHGHDEEDARERFEFLVESEGKRVREFLAVAERP